MNLLPLILLLTLILLPGMTIWYTFGSQLKLKLSGLEILFLWFLTGTALVSWLSLTLAEARIFSLPLLSAILIGTTILMLGWGWQHGRFKSISSKFSWEWTDAIVIILLLLSIFLSGRPSEYIIGGRDHGVYINTGIHIAKAGGILVQDSGLTSVPAELKPTLVWPETRVDQPGFPGPWSEGQRMSGLTIRDLDEGIYLPHAFHLYPALIALFFAADGISTALLATPFLSLLGSLAIFTTTTRLLGKPIGLLTLLLLTFSVTQVWFTGYPTAEIMVQPFFWGALYSTILLMENGDKYTAILAGGLLGLLQLTKLDTVLIPVAFGIVFLYLWLQYQFKLSYWWGIGLYVALSLQSAWHASFISTTYFLDHAIRNLLPTFISQPLITATSGYSEPASWINRFLLANQAMLLLFALLLLGLWGILHGLRPHINRIFAHSLLQQKRTYQIVFILFSIAMIGVLFFSLILPIPALQQTQSAIHLSRLYLTRMGLLIAAVGWFLLIINLDTTIKRLTLFIIVFSIAPLYILGAGTSPDHFWVIRRFMPIAFPAFLVAMGWLIWFAASYRHAKWVMRGLWVTLLIVILAGFLQHIRYIGGIVEYEGLTQQLEEFNQELPDNAILLIQTGTQAQQLSLPLWLLFDKSVFSIRGKVLEDVQLETAVAFLQENNRPVFWVGTQETPPPIWQSWQQQHQFSYTIDVLKMETPLDRIPHETKQFQLQLDVYQLSKP